MKTWKTLVLCTMLAAAPACKKKEDKAPTPVTEGSGSSAMAGSGSAAPVAAGSGSDTMAGSGSAMAGSGSAMAGSGSDTAMAGSGSAMAGSDAAKAPTTPAVDDNEDHVVVMAKHKPAKPTDPVTVRFEKFKVVKATFDPKKIEGGKAEIELDLSSLKTDSSKRDDHLKSPAYIDVSKFATATIDIGNVKHKADKTYSADATVKFHGVTKKYPVTFDVIEQKDDSIRIKGEQEFSRLDFKVGTDPAKDAQQQVDTPLTIQMVLTLKKT